MAEKAGGRLLIPFAIWSVFYSGVSVLQKVLSGQQINIVGVVCRFIVGKSATPFYYIVVLLQFALITPWLVRVVEKKSSLERMLWLVTPAYLLYVYLWNFTTGESPFLYEMFFPAWFGFYYLGIQIKCDGYESLKNKLGNAKVVISTLVLSCFEAFMLRYCGMQSGFYTSQITVGSFLYSVTVIYWLLTKIDKEHEGNLFSKIGDCSYGIFYIHMFILMVAGKAVSMSGINNSWFLYWGTRFILTSLMSYAAVRTVQLIMRKMGCNKILSWIGFL